MIVNITPDYPTSFISKFLYNGFVLPILPYLRLIMRQRRNAILFPLSCLPFTVYRLLFIDLPNVMCKSMCSLLCTVIRIYEYEYEYEYKFKFKYKYKYKYKLALEKTTANSKYGIHLNIFDHGLILPPVNAIVQL